MRTLTLAILSAILLVLLSMCKKPDDGTEDPACSPDTTIVTPPDTTINPPDTTVMPPDTFQVVNLSHNWFDISYAAPQTYVISEGQSSQGNVSYLIIGDDKAVMFDTGTGENPPEGGFKIRHILEQLTPRPITLLLSHFHFDHNQNIAEFDHVAFPALADLQASVGADDIYHFTADDLVEGSTPGSVEVAEWLPLNTDIDLGNRTIEVIHLGGHSRESVAIIDHENKMAFMGDFIYNGPLYVFETDLSIYAASVDSLLSMLTSDYVMYGAHGAPVVPYSDLQQLKDFLQCIDNGNCAGVPGTLFGVPVMNYSYQGMQLVVFL